MGVTTEQWRASIGGWVRGQLMCGTSVCKESGAAPWFHLLVLVALLIIGGIEMNPGPNQVSVTTMHVHNALKFCYMNHGTSVCKESGAAPWFHLLVLVALLIIGGIEMNPGPNQVSVTTTHVHNALKFCYMNSLQY